MNLKEWNKIQSEIFTQYGLDKMVMHDIIEFNQICCIIAYLRKYESADVVRCLMSIIVENELHWYTNKEGD